MACIIIIICSYAPTYHTNHFVAPHIHLLSHFGAQPSSRWSTQKSNLQNHKFYSTCHARIKEFMCVCVYKIIHNYVGQLIKGSTWEVAFILIWIFIYNFLHLLWWTAWIQSAQIHNVWFHSCLSIMSSLYVFVVKFWQTSTLLNSLKEYEKQLWVVDNARVHPLCNERWHFHHFFFHLISTWNYNLLSPLIIFASITCRSNNLDVLYYSHMSSKCVWPPHL